MRATNQLDQIQFSLRLVRLATCKCLNAFKIDVTIILIFQASSSRNKIKYHHWFVFFFFLLYKIKVLIRIQIVLRYTLENKILDF